MTAAQTKGAKMILGTYRDREEHEKSRKQGTKKIKKIVLKASVVTTFPVSATEPSRGPCHTICHLHPALVGNGIKLFGGWWWFWIIYCTYLLFTFYTTMNLNISHWVLFLFNNGYLTKRGTPPRNIDKKGDTAFRRRWRLVISTAYSNLLRLSCSLGSSQPPTVFVFSWSV